VIPPGDRGLQIKIYFGGSKRIRSPYQSSKVAIQIATVDQGGALPQRFAPRHYKSSAHDCKQNLTHLVNIPGIENRRLMAVIGIDLGTTISCVACLNAMGGGNLWQCIVSFLSLMQAPPQSLALTRLPILRLPKKAPESPLLSSSKPRKQGVPRIVYCS
jgi:hypothetical protein